VSRDYLLRVGKIIEPEVQGATGGDHYAVGADRIAVRKENRDRDVGVGIAGIQDAGGLVRDQRTVRKRALRGDISFRDRPSLVSNRVHRLAFFCR